MCVFKSVTGSVFYIYKTVQCFLTAGKHWQFISEYHKSLLFGCKEIILDLHLCTNYLNQNIVDVILTYNGNLEHTFFLIYILNIISVRND